MKKNKENESRLEFPKLQDMPFANKRALGNFAEKWLRKYFVERGYEAIRTYNSESPFDLLVFKDNTLTMVQCRSGSSPKWPLMKMIAKMAAFPCPPNTVKLIARLDFWDTEPRFRNISDNSKVWRVKKTAEAKQLTAEFRANNKKKIEREKAKRQKS